MNVNKAIICGNLTRDPEARTLPSGQAISAFGVATNRTWTDADGQKQEQVEFHNVVAFGKLAEICNQYLSKGRLVFVEGRLQTNSWEGQDNIKRNRTEIIANNMQMGPRTGEQIVQQEEKKEIKSEKPNKNEIKVEDIPF